MSIYTRSDPTIQWRLSNFSDASRKQIFQDIEPAKHVRLSQKGLETIREASHNDDALTELTNVIHQGWPEHKRDLQPSLRTQWPYRDELVTSSLKRSKVVISEQLHPLMLQRAHQSHQEPEVCIRRARDVIFWPGVASEIRHLISQCSTCNSYGAQQQKEPLMLPEIPNTPWNIVAQDTRPLYICRQVISDYC